MKRQDIISKLDKLIDELSQAELNERIEGGGNWSAVVLGALKGALEERGEEKLADIVHKNYIFGKLNPDRFKDN